MEEGQQGEQVEASTEGGVAGVVDVEEEKRWLNLASFSSFSKHWIRVLRMPILSSFSFTRFSRRVSLACVSMIFR